MRFRNVQPPEGINVSRHSPLLDLFLLSLGLLVGLVLLTIVLLWVGGALGRNLPVAWENALADIFIDAPTESEAGEHWAITSALQAISDRLAKNIVDDEDVRIIVHYSDDDIVNAFATVGGHIYISRGLIERLSSENALAMVLAHEIAHVANRDVMAAMTGVLMLQLVYSVLLGQSADELGNLVLGAGGVASRGFSREAERDADAAALRALMATYGHVSGADDLFEVLQGAMREAGRDEPPAFLSTHPVTQERIDTVRRTARENGWPLEGREATLPSALTELPEATE